MSHAFFAVNRIIYKKNRINTARFDQLYLTDAMTSTNKNAWISLRAQESVLLA